MDEHEAYRPPPAFAPPLLRVAPVNETQVLGGTTYPYGPFAPTRPSWQPPGPLPPGSENYAGSGNPADSENHARGENHAGGGHPSDRRWRTVGVVAAVAVVLVTIITVLATGGLGRSDRRSISLPLSAGGFAQLETITGGQLGTLFTSGGFGAIPVSDIDNARAGLYSRRGVTRPNLVLIGFDGSASPTIGRQLSGEDPGTVTSDVIAGTGASHSTAVDPGPLGGSIRCARVLVDGSPAALGVWADADTLGIVLLVDPLTSYPLNRVAAITRTLRAATEH